MKSEVLDRAIAEVNRDRILELASELIMIPSVTGEERKVADRAAELLERMGVLARKVGEAERPIVLGDLNKNSKPLIALNGHLDTVPITDSRAWKTNPFEPVLDSGLLYGRGTSDMKASCAVIMHVLEILQKHQDSLKGGVQAQLVPDEEKGGKSGTLLLIDLMRRGELPMPDYAIIGEKSNLKIRISERGSCRVNIRFVGRATHTAYARVEGVNAIALASKAVLALEKPLERWDPYIGYPVISVNAIKAGSAINQVPDECVISIDRRTVRGETKESVLGEIKEAIDKAINADGNGRYEMEPVESFTPANYTSPDSRLVKAFQDAVPKIVGHAPEFFVEWAGGTDGRHYREVGVETVGFGPKGEHAHGPNEFVDVNSLEVQAKVYLSTIFRLLS